MHKRAYYSDSYTVQFEANVAERLLMNDQPVVILDRTYYYPTSGGQPCDRGHLDGCDVVDVQVRPEDGAVLHFLDSKLEKDQVTAQIDWTRRFDHMQHHTGQHILSQAFIQVADANTIGFHLSDTSVTIDLDKRELTADQINRAESVANKIVWQNRRVTVREVPIEEAGKLRLRKIPPTEDELLRLIDIEDFDLTACGGTHVSRTGEVGLIKVIKQERRGEKQRIEFRCGGRALDDYRHKQNIIAQLTARLTTGGAELDAAVERLQEENKEARRQLKKQRTELSRLEAQRLVEQALPIGTAVMVSKVFADRDAGQLRSLGNQLTSKDGVIALLGLAGSRSHLIFSRSANAPGEMDDLLRRALVVLGSESGGGTDTYAQGVGPAANVATVQKAIEAAENQLLEELGAMG